MNFANIHRNSTLHIAKDFLGNKQGLSLLVCSQEATWSVSQLLIPTWGSFLYTKHSNINRVKTNLIIANLCLYFSALMRGS